jgi:hypothetical protein
MMLGEHVVILSKESSRRSCRNRSLSLHACLSRTERLALESNFGNLTPKAACNLSKKKTQISAGVLLMRVCGTQSWWGNFFGNVLQEFFHSENIQIFPQDR